MPLYYRLGNPGITAISVDGIAHAVNADGLLEVHETNLTPNLVAEITGHFGGRLQNPETDTATPQMQADEDERQILFIQLDTITGRRTDRRRSLPQLRELLAQHQARQARTEGASTALATTPGSAPAS